MDELFTLAEAREATTAPLRFSVEAEKQKPADGEHDSEDIWDLSDLFHSIEPGRFTL